MTQAEDDRRTVVALSEVRELLQAGRRYLAGDCSIQELNGCAVNLKLNARMFGLHPAVERLADDWIESSNRRWNEWGEQQRPLTEAEFVRWLTAALGDS
jgi:hypothetical protein